MATDEQSSFTGHGGLAARPIDVLSVDEICDRYPGQWILLRIMEQDEDGWPMAGRVLFRAPEQRDIIAEIQVHPPAASIRDDERGFPICIFQAYPFIGPGPEYEALLAGLQSDLSAS